MVIHRRAAVLGLGLAATMIISIIVGPVAPAGADPVGDKKAEAAALAQRINTEGQQVEILAEQYNGAEVHLNRVRQQLADSERRLAEARVRADRNRAALAHEALVSYIHGGVATSASMRSFSGTVDLAVQQGYFRLATSNQADALAQLRQSERQLREQQSALQNAQRDSQTALASVTSRQRAVQAAVATSQATLGQVQGDLVQLVAQQQAEMAAQQQAQVQAHLLAGSARSGGTAQGAGSAAGTGSASRASPTVANTVGGVAKPLLTFGRPTSTQPTSAQPTTSAPVKSITIAAPPATVPPTTTASPAPPPSSGAAAAIAYAKAQIGKPYQWGGAGPDSFDCSGLTMRAWGAAGVSLPHHAASQYAATAHIRIADLQPGDLVFYGSDLHHEGLYIGGGQMIEAPSTGQFVRYASIYRSDLQPFGGRPG